MKPLDGELTRFAEDMRRTGATNWREIVNRRIAEVRDRTYTDHGVYLLVIICESGSGVAVRVAGVGITDLREPEWRQTRNERNL